MIQIAPSLLSADFSRLSEELESIKKAGADMVHLDVMDGHFVPNLTFGAPVIRALRPCTDLLFDAHLMVENPEDYVGPMAEAGVQMLSFHAEAAVHADKIISDIRSRGMSPGMAVNPGTSLSLLDTVLPQLDFVLVMTVNPGFGGQKLIPYCIDKIHILRRMADTCCHRLKIEADGGINPENASLLKIAGADRLVAGSAVFGAEDRKKMITALRG
jgi:ribulose-phosphate 3-epimerase